MPLFGPRMKAFGFVFPLAVRSKINIAFPTFANRRLWTRSTAVAGDPRSCVPGPLYVAVRIAIENQYTVGSGVGRNVDLIIHRIHAHLSLLQNSVGQKMS